MADSEITTLPNSNTVNDTDVVPIVYDVAGVPATEKRTIGELKAHALLSAVLLDGRAGGQTIYGGTAASNDLVLSGTSNVTKGSVIITKNPGTVVSTSYNLSVQDTGSAVWLEMLNGAGTNKGAFFGLSGSGVDGDAFELWNWQAGAIKFYTAPTASAGNERLTIGANGKVSITDLTASQLLSTDASKNLTSLSTSTYPDLTEISYVKGVTSAIQTQFGTKVTGPASATDNAIARYDATTGKIIQNSGVTINDAGYIKDAAGFADRHELHYLQSSSIRLVDDSEITSSGGFQLFPAINENVEFQTSGTGRAIAQTILQVGTSLELGHATDTTLSRVSAGVIAVEGKPIPTVSSGAGAPATTPTKVGDIYIDTTGDNSYVAVGTASSADWKNTEDAGGSFDPHYIYVAATDATAREKAVADYQCDGTADEVQINLAITAVRTTGGQVILSSGAFAIAASIDMDGITAEGGDNPQVRLIGSGIDSTFLNGASNVDVIETGQRAKYEIAHLTIAVAGSGDGIHQTAGTERGNWQSHVHDIFIKSNFTDHTGWGIDMESPFRMRFTNIEMNGVASGMRLACHTNAFNPGNISIDRMFIDLWNHASNASAVGLRLNTFGTDSTGVMNLVTVNRFDIYGGTNLTSSIGIDIVGSTSSYGDSRHHTFTSLNLEDLKTCIKFTRGRDCSFNDINYSRVLSGGKFIELDANSHNNKFENAFVVAQGSGQTFDLITDANTSANLPNSLTRVDGWQPATVTINATLATNTILQRIDLSGGSPTIDADITNRNNVAFNQTIELGHATDTTLSRTAAGEIAVEGKPIPTVSNGAGAPASTPIKVGDIYIDTTGDDAYIAVGTASSADWEKSNDGAGGGTGDVVGPASATDNAIARFDSTTGKLLQNSSVTINDSGSTYNVNGINVITALTGTDNYLFGGAGNLTMSGSYNTAMGSSSLSANTTGYSNTASGLQSLYSNTTGFRNSALGVQSLFSNTNGLYNTASGYNSLHLNTGGDENTAIGAYALNNNVHGNDNVALGVIALSELGSVQTAGDFNVGTSYIIESVGTTDFTLIGASANTVGTIFTATGVGTGTGTAAPSQVNNNTAVGYSTGRGIIHGVNNTILGANVTGLLAGLSNNIIIADGEGNQRINVGSTGNVGIGTTSPTEKLDVVGNINVTGTVDGVDIATDVPLKVTGPASAADNAIARFDSTTGKLIQNSGVYINDSGWLGAGLSNPSVLFHSYLASGGFYHQYWQTANTTLAVGIGGDDRGILGTTNSTAMTLITDNTTRLQIASTGEVGIGDTTPQPQLEVASDKNTLANVGVSSNYQSIFRHKVATNYAGAGIGFSVTNTDGNIGAAIIHERIGGNSQGNLRFYTKRSTVGGVAPEQAMVIDNNGRLGIGTTSPSSTLDVAGDITVSGTVELGHATDTTLSRSAAGVLAVEGVVVPTISSTNTLTNKRVTKRVLALSANSATPAIDTDSYDVVNITSQTAAITSFTTNLTGTATAGQQLLVTVTGTAAVSITWGASFANGPVALPTVTVTTTKLSTLFIYSGSVWEAYATGSTV